MSTRTFQAVTIACASVLCAGAVSAATYSPTDGDAAAPTTTAATEQGLDTDRTTSTSTTEPTSTDAAAVDASTDEPASTTTVPGTSTTTTASPTTAVSTSSRPTSAAAVNAAPIAPGRYEYDTSGTMTIGSSTRDLPPVTLLTAEQADGAGRQDQIRDLRDAKGDGTVTTTTFRYAPEGVYLERLVIEASFSGLGQTGTLTSTEPLLLVPTGAPAGTTTTGTLTGDGITAQISFTITALGADTSTAELVADLSGDVQGRQTSTFTARNRDLLTVEEHVDSDVTSSGIRVRSNYEATLR